MICHVPQLQACFEKSFCISEYPILSYMSAQPYKHEVIIGENDNFYVTALER